MRYGVAVVVALLLLLAGIALGGAGHGWVAGSFGCFALAPLSFFLALNGLSRRPSRRLAVALLLTGLAVFAAVAFATHGGEGHSAEHFVRVAGTRGVAVAVGAYLGWLVLAVLAVPGGKRVQQHGT